MIAPDPHPDTARERALALLDVFRTTVLPGFLRRIHTWSGFDARRHADVLDDIGQELALDCVANPSTILALPVRERHRRWLQLSQRHHYALRVRVQRRRGGDESQVPFASPPPSAMQLTLTDEDQRMLDRLARHAEFLGNGRLSMSGTAAAMGIGRARLRGLCTRLARALGIDATHVTFWRRRLAEAVCAVAAARMHDSGELRLWNGAARRGFDPVAARRRLERIRAALSARPIDRGLREELDVLAPRDALPLLTPRQLLALAEEIAPDDPAIPQWRFEAELLSGDFATAARCLRRAAHLEPDRVRTALARARLSEARGNTDRARATLTRAVGRIGADPRLGASLQALGGSPRHYAPSAVRTASTTVRSHTA